MDDITAAFEDSTEKTVPLATAVKQNDAFTKDVTNYFADYVSTGLTANKLPRKHITGQYIEGLFQNLHVDTYPQLNKNLYKNFVSGLPQQTFVVTQNKYTAHSDDHMLSLLSKDVASLSQKHIDALLSALTHIAASKQLESISTVADVTEQIFVALPDVIKSELIVPLLTSMQKSLEDSSDLQIWVQRVEREAADRLLDTFYSSLKQVLNAYFENHDSADSLLSTLETLIPLKEVQATLLSYVEDVRLNDAYQHIYALHRSVQVTLRAELQLYLGVITVGSDSFPLFYTPVSSKHTYPSVTLGFENRIFVNTEALLFAKNQMAAKAGVVVTIPDLPAALYTDQDNSSQAMQQIVGSIIDAFALHSPMSIPQPNKQLSTNGIVSVSNELLLSVARPDNRALARDYHAIHSNTKAHNSMSGYLRSLVMEPQPRFIEEISEAWDAKSAIEKLLPINPLSTNDEQKQVLAALDKPNCETIVVKGAPSTGKSHLALSATLQALSKQQTVLVISNTASAANDIYRKVSDTFQLGTAKSGLHTPVLNLHHTDLLDTFDEQAIDVIAKSVQNYESRAGELSAAKKRKVEDATETLANLVQSAENINLHEVEQTVFNERRFSGKNWIDDEPIDGISTSIQRLHRAIQYVRASEASYLLPYVEESQQRAIDEFIRIFKEYEKANKNVSSRLPEFIVRYRKLLPEQREDLQSSLAYVQSNYRQFVKILKSHNASKWLSISDNTTFDQLDHQETIYQKLLEIAKNANKLLRRHHNEAVSILSELESYKVEPAEITGAFNNYIEQVATLKSKLFGFSGRTLVVENLNKQLVKSLPQYSLPEPEKQVDTLALMSELVQQISEQLAVSGLSVNYWKEVIYLLQTDNDIIKEISQIVTTLNAPARYEFMADFHVYEADNLLANISLLHNATDLNKVFKENANFAKLFGITAIGHLLSRPQDFSSKINKLSSDLGEAAQLDESKQIIKQFIKEYPAASKRIGISVAAGSLEVIEETFANSDSDYIKEYLAHKKKEQDIRAYFDEVMVDAFNKNIRELEQILAVELQHAVSKQFVSYITQNFERFASLKKSLQLSHKLSEKDFKHLQKGFPCIVGDITAVSELLPLASQLFDLVIIENAGSMSIAEVIPAALRANKLLVIGDESQVSTVENSSNVLTAMHTFTISNSLRSLLDNMPADTKNAIIAKTQHSIDVTHSALAFFSQYASYEHTLTRQYGVYSEISSFANKYYFNNTLSSLMSRARPLPDILTMSQVNPTSSDVNVHINEAEVRFIVDELTKLKDSGFTGSIGIITPYAEQAALIQKELDECVINDWFERRDLVVMTFDTCQDTSRDYVFYSLVSSSQYDKHLQKFPSTIGLKTFSGDIRSDRLLAGLTKARQTMHFVLSMKVADYTGGLGVALTFYQSKLQGANVPIKGTTTDILLPTETNITQAYARTKFARKYADKAVFIAKYPFADYLRILSPNYQKPLYKMYFLLTFAEQSIVIEYDDFKERFLQTESGVKDSGAVYLTAQDIYAEKVLESYDYKFLRLNKFNLGSDPSRTLDKYLSEIIKNPQWPNDNGFSL